MVQTINGYLGGGLVYTGLLARRVQDQIGLAINHVVLDAVNPHTVRLKKSSETAFELTYRYNAADWLAIQPDAQIIVHPAGTLPTALVAGLRFSLTLTKNLAAKLNGSAP